jgi:hypothetical protein
MEALVYIGHLKKKYVPSKSQTELSKINQSGSESERLD